jgi:hypothetical protein
MLSASQADVELLSLIGDTNATCEGLRAFPEHVAARAEAAGNVALATLRCTGLRICHHRATRGLHEKRFMQEANKTSLRHAGRKASVVNRDRHRAPKNDAKAECSKNISFVQVSSNSPLPAYDASRQV